MKNHILKTVLLCTFFMLISCQKEKQKPKLKIKPNIAGVVLSFDDDYINDWFTTNKKLKHYSWKGTFFVSKINTLKSSEISKLLELQKEGHEIAGHSLHHYNALDFIHDHSTDEYLYQEIDPMLELMNFYGLKTSSFAYPYGRRNKELDAALLTRFKIIRGRAYCEENPEKQGSYYNHSRLVFSFSIDDTHSHFNTEHLLNLLDYAKKNNTILILNSHQTVNTITGDYQTRNATLELICQYINQNKMKFYTLSELNQLDRKHFFNTTMDINYTLKPFRKG